MTDYLFTVILNAAKPPRQVAPLRHATRATSPASTGEHTPGKAKPTDLILLQHLLRGKPPFWEILHYVQNDTSLIRHRERSVAIPKIGVCPLI